MMNKDKVYQLLILVLLLSSGLFYSSCKNKKLSPIEKEQMTNDSLVLAQKNQNVSLSFNGIILGSSLKKTIEKIKNDTVFNIIDNSDGQCSVATKLIDNDEDVLYINADIYAFKDKIFYIQIKTYEESISNRLGNLYNIYYSKKGYEMSKEESPWEDEKADYTECKTKKTQSWDFKNQMLEIITNGIMTQERYLKDADKRYYENRYGTRNNEYFQSMEINYIDKTLYKMYNEMIAKKNEAIKQLDERSDSLNMIKKRNEEIKKRQRVQKIMERQSL